MVNHPNMKNPGPSKDEVRRTREQWGFTQKQAAAVIGWGEHGWQQIEVGMRNLTALMWRVWKHQAGIEQMPFKPRDRNA